MASALTKRGLTCLIPQNYGGIFGTFELFVREKKWLGSGLGQRGAQEQKVASNSYVEGSLLLLFNWLKICLDATKKPWVFNF